MLYIIHLRSVLARALDPQCHLGRAQRGKAGLSEAIQDCQWAPQKLGSWKS